MICVSSKNVYPYDKFYPGDLKKFHWTTLGEMILKIALPTGSIFFLNLSTQNIKK